MIRVRTSRDLPRRGHRDVAAIDDVDRLRAVLQTAIELEHSTIPPYLCALYSIRAGTNIEAAAIIETVVMEEMLHMVLVANVLNAVGGTPSIGQSGFVPRYPCTLPHSDGRVVVHLRRFSPEALDTFLRIERPEPPRARPRVDRYHTIGQFYAGIEAGLQRLDAEGGPLFTGEHSRQIAGNGRVYGMAGESVAVHDLDSAMAALAIVVDQGEGIDHTIHDGDTSLGGAPDLAHYYRFAEIAGQRRFRPSDTPRTGPTGPPLAVDFDAVWPMRTDPSVDGLAPGSEVRALSEDFNAVYGELLAVLDRGLSGEPDLLADAVGLMWSIRWKAEALMRVPIGNGETAGPTFRPTPARSANARPDAPE
jgi:hypothetical protein